MTWLKSTLLILALTSAKAEEHIKLEEIASKRWTHEEDKPIAIDSTISDDRVHLGYLTCAQKLPYGLNCNVTSHNVQRNGATSVKTCSFSHFLPHTTQLRTMSIRLKALRDGNVLVTFPTTFVNIDYVADGLEARTIDMRKCEYMYNAIVTNTVTRTFTLIAYEDKYDVVAYGNVLECEEQYCLFTYDYGGDQVRDPTPVLTKNDLRELAIFTVANDSSAEGYFAATRELNDYYTCNVHAVNEDGSANKSVKYRLDESVVYDSVYYASENEVMSIVWQEANLKRNKFVRFDKSMNLLVNEVFDTGLAVRILAVCNLKSGDLLVWAVRINDDFSLRKDYSILKVDRSGKVSKSFTYYDVESVFNDKSTVKVSSIREANGKICFAICYEVNAKSQLRNEHRWDFKCIDESSVR